MTQSNQKIKNIFKKYLQNFLLIVFSLVITFIICEYISRLIFFVNIPKITNAKKEGLLVTGSSLSPEMKKNYKGRCISGEFDVSISTNSDGFRDTEFNIKKSKNAFRILVLGDSYTFGVGCESNEIFTELLEHQLNIDKKKKYEVYNLGIPGVGTLEELEILKKTIKYSPDLVLLCFHAEFRYSNGNDLIDNYNIYKLNPEAFKNDNNLFAITDLNKKTIACENKTIKTNSKLKKEEYTEKLYSIRRYIMEKFNLYRIVELKIGLLLKAYLKNNDKQREDVKVGWEITKKSFHEINQICINNNAEFVIFYVPYITDIIKNDYTTYNALDNFCQKNNIKLIENPMPYFYKYKNNYKLVHFPLDGHWTPLGHDIIQQILYKYISKNMRATQ